MHKYICKIYQCLRNYTGCQFGMKYLRIYNVLFVNIPDLAAVYVIPVKCTRYPHQYTWSTLVFYFVFAV